MKKSLKKRIEQIEAQLKSRAEPDGYWSRLYDVLTDEELQTIITRCETELERFTEPEEKASIEAMRLHDMSTSPGYRGPYYPPPESGAEDLDDEALAKLVFDKDPELLERCLARVAAKVAP